MFTVISMSKGKYFNENKYVICRFKCTCMDWGIFARKTGQPEIETKIKVQIYCTLQKQSVNNIHLLPRVIKSNSHFVKLHFCSLYYVIAVGPKELTRQRGF